MKKNLLLLFAIIISYSYSFTQNKTIVIYDLKNQTIDSIRNIVIDSTIQQKTTTYHIGNFNSNITILEQTPPTQNVVSNGQFTLKRKAALDYDLNTYPIRTSVKIFYMENDTLKQRCSGSMISSKHLLTAAHCYSQNDTFISQFDSLYICPVYNDGTFNPNFNCSFVQKAYFIKDWTSLEDIGILELENAIGYTTGWLGIGFNNTGNIFTNEIFYKFSYPSAYIPFIDSIVYNGDTLYYNYGKVQLMQNYIGVPQLRGIPGESGSSIIHIQNNQLYTSYGVLSYSNNLQHSKLNNEIFHLFTHIIKDDTMTTNLNNPTYEENIVVSPNPVSDNFSILNLPINQAVAITIFDGLGRLIYSDTNYQSMKEIDISNFPNGYYFLKIRTEKSSITQKILKIK
jgi:V8-like Glu-specific endopeptidase